MMVPNLEVHLNKNWYYVLDNNRIGPIKQNVLLELFHKKQISLDTYLWTNGEKTWKKAYEFEELKKELSTTVNSNPSKTLSQEVKMSSLIWAQLTPTTQIIFIKAKEGNFFGPFSLAMLENLFKQKRVQAYDQVIVPGMDCWDLLGHAFPKSFPLSNDSKTKSNQYDFYEEVPISARIKFLGESFWCLVRDFSIGGAQILTSQLKVHRGDQFNIEIMAPNAQQSVIQIPCRIGRVLNENLGYFVIFEKVPKQANELLSQMNLF